MSELAEQPVGVAAADIGEVRLGVGLAVGIDPEPVRVGRDELRAEEGNLNRPDIEDGLGPRAMDEVDELAKVEVGLLHLLRVDRDWPSGPTMSHFRRALIVITS